MNYQTLITASQLHQLLDDPGTNQNGGDLAVVDCRFSLAEPDLGEIQHRDAHIPTAVYANLDHDLAGAVQPGETGRHPLPNIDDFAQTLGAWGIGNRGNSDTSDTGRRYEPTQVIAYDDAGGAIAARLWWLLRWLGHDRVAVLDGDLTAWKDAGYAMTSAASTKTRATFVPSPRTHLLATTNDIEAGGFSHLVDSRSRERYLGQSEPFDAVAGHIPGAANRPFQDNLKSGRFRSAESLRTEFEELLHLQGNDVTRNTQNSHEAVFYCGSGVTAAHNLLAMAHAGLEPGRLYNGSWSEWIANGSRPTA